MNEVKRKSLIQAQERLSMHRLTARMLSLKLHAWGALLERQHLSDGYSELEGLGIELSEYGQKLRKLAHSLDLVEIRLARVLANEGVRPRSTDD